MQQYKLQKLRGKPFFKYFTLYQQFHYFPNLLYICKLLCVENRFSCFVFVPNYAETQLAMKVLKCQLNCRCLYRVYQNVSTQNENNLHVKTIAWADFEKSGKLSTCLIVQMWFQMNKLSCQLDVKISDSDLDLKSQKMIAQKIDRSEL